MGKKIARTYKFNDELIARIDAAALELVVFPGPLIELLLTRALDEVEADRWKLRRRPVAYVPTWNDE